MIYLLTYKDGIKALALSNTNRGLAIEAGTTTVYPLLVSTAAQNASNVRIKVNNTIKSVAYAPSLIIPGVLCAKVGTTYTDPSGISYNGKCYRKCYYDNKYAQYVAYSKYTEAGGFCEQYIAVSVDGKNWIEKGTEAGSSTLVKNHKLANTKEGVILFWPQKVNITQWESKIIVNGVLIYFDGTQIQFIKVFSFDATLGWQVDEWVNANVKITTNGEDIILYDFYIEGYFNGNYQPFHTFVSINVDTYTVTVLQKEYDDLSFLRELWYNRVLNKLFYKKNGVLYWGSDGIHFTQTNNNHSVSYGNLNGGEVFSNGISYDGINIAKYYTYRPNAYDPVSGKYIRVEISHTVVGSYWEYYYDIYESSDLINWTKVITKYNPTVIFPQTLEDVNSDGYACVKGF